MDCASVTDAGHKENEVGQGGESKPSNDENFSVDRAPNPTGSTQSYESKHGGTQRDCGGVKRSYLKSVETLTGSVPTDFSTPNLISEFTHRLQFPDRTPSTSLPAGEYDTRNSQYQ